MSGEERRQHMRVDDYVYFDYRIVNFDEPKLNLGIQNDLLGDMTLKYTETAQYFQPIDYELACLAKTITDPAVAHCLNLLNTKIDYLSHRMMIPPQLNSRKINISLGGMAFTTLKAIENDTLLKVLLYTKPKLTPIIIEGSVVYSKYQNDTNYRTAIAFSPLTVEQEKLLAQHILLAQVTCRAD